MSSFVRKGGVSAAEQGTRPGPAGQTLVSSGHADVDRLLGGGLPLGSLTLILEDSWSQHHVTLVRYFLGEGTATGHCTLLAAAIDPPAGTEAFLPKLIDPAVAAAEKDSEKQSAREEDAVQLRIAWQYGRYLKPQGGKDTGLGAMTSSGGALKSSGVLGQQQQQRGPGRPTGRDWCHVFDLSKPANAATLAHHSSPQLILSSAIEARKSLITSAAEFVQALKAHSSGPQGIGRLAVLSLGSGEWNFGVGTVEGRRSVIQSLIQLKAVVRDSKCAAVVTVPTALHTESDRSRMAHVADVVLALEAVQDDSDIVRLAPDSQSVAGLLHLRKLPSLGSLIAPEPQNSLYLIRQRRKRLAITPVEIDPEAEEAEAAAKGGTSSAASVLCSGPAKSTSNLDF